ncbi:MAG: SAM-dependent methyltransferase [Flavobacteriales bacterium]|nr:SAM-dependent methyltransferase [Flavobacteriales bacterium]
MKGTLYLLPSPIAEGFNLNYIPPITIKKISELSFFVVEDIKHARRYIKKANPNADINEITFFVLNEHTPIENIGEYLSPLLLGNNMGIITDAGCPGIADPGSELVRLAHKNNIKVEPLPGPSSIFLTLMASGLNGQQFAFNGYLPREKELRIKKIKELESEAKRKNQTQLFIETPYRNQHLFDDLLKHLQSSTQLCIGININSPQEKIETYSTENWKKKNGCIPKEPTVFAII